MGFEEETYDKPKRGKKKEPASDDQVGIVDDDENENTKDDDSFDWKQSLKEGLEDSEDENKVGEDIPDHLLALEKARALIVDSKEEILEGVETYAEKGEKTKDFILLQIHIKRKYIDEGLLDTISPFVKKEEKKGVKQNRSNVVKKGGISFDDFGRIVEIDGYKLDQVWWRDDTEYVADELAGEKGVAIGFVFKKNGNANNEKALEIWKKTVENRIFNVDFHANKDGSTVMSAFGGQEYKFKDLKDRKKRQVFLNDEVLPIIVGEKLIYGKKNENKWNEEGKKIDNYEDWEEKPGIGDGSLEENENISEQIISQEEEKEDYWESRAWSDFSIIVSQNLDNNEDKKKAWLRLNRNGVDLNKVVGEKNNIKQRLVEAIKVAASGRSNEVFGDVDSAKQELRDYFGVKVVDEIEKPKKNDEKVDKKEIMPVWDDEVINDLDIATWAKENEEERNKAWGRLEARGLILRKVEVDDQVVFDAISFLTNKGKILKGKFKDKEEAEKFLKEYFRVDIEQTETVLVDKKLEKVVDNLVAKGADGRETLAEMMVDGSDEKLFRWAVGIMTGANPNDEFPTKKDAFDYFMKHIDFKKIDGVVNKERGEESVDGLINYYYGGELSLLDSGSKVSPEKRSEERILDSLFVALMLDGENDFVRNAYLKESMRKIGIDTDAITVSEKLREAFSVYFDEIKIVPHFFKSKEESRDYIYEVFDIDRLRNEALGINKEESEKLDIVWDKDTYDDLYVGGWNSSDAKSIEARRRLLKKNIDLKKAFEDKTNQNRIARAITIVRFNKPINGISVERAKSELKIYFEELKSEKKDKKDKENQNVDGKTDSPEELPRDSGDFVEVTVEPVTPLAPEARPVVVERNPVKRLELMCKPERWQQILNIIESELDVDRKKKYRLVLRAAIYQLEHPEERVKTAGRWENSYLPLLKQLGVEDSRLV